MKIIIPMAGMGKRLRPHTLTTPKPLLPVAGKPIVHRLIEKISEVTEQDVEEIAFVIGDFGKETEAKLAALAAEVNAKASFYYQREPLGTAHAVHCALPALEGEIIVAFADTLFLTEQKLQLGKTSEGVIWVQKVPNPEQFGVVKLDENNLISDFIEKPQEPVSDLAIIGIYYFNDGRKLANELQYLIDNNIVVKGEYQLTDALENLKNKGFRFAPGEVTEWLDCGNKNAVLNTHKRLLAQQPLVAAKATGVVLENAVTKRPYTIGADTKIHDSVLKGYVAVGKKCVIKNSIIRNSIIQDNAHIENLLIEDSIIGSHTRLKGRPETYDTGDYNRIDRSDW